MKEFLPILAQCPLFDQVRMEDIPPMLACMGARVGTWEKGACVFCEGDRADRVGILLEGRLDVVREDWAGNRSVVVAVQAGELFGETFACAGEEVLPVSVVCKERSTVMLINVQRITHSCSNACAFHQQAVMNLLRGLAQKALVLNRKVLVLSRRTTREKLLTYLTEQARLQGSSEFTIAFDRQSLADYLGVERTALSAEIGKLRREGLLETTRSHFKLL